MWFVPDPTREALRRDLGTLGQMASRACLIEPFSRTPGADTIRRCMAKLLNWIEVRRRDENQPLTGETPGGPPPRMWVLSPGRPATALRRLCLRPSRSVGPGSWHVPGWGLWVLVLSELLRTRPTLPLRLMGRGKTRRQAVSELVALPQEDRDKRPLVELLVRLRFELPQGSREEEEYLMDSQEALKLYQAELLQEGRQDTLREAAWKLISHRWPELRQEAERSLGPVQDAGVLSRVFDALLEASDAEAALAVLRAAAP